MEQYKIYKLLNVLPVSKFVKRKTIKVKNLPNGQNSINENIRLSTMPKSNSRDHSHAYIVVTRRTTVAGTNDDNIRNKKLKFMNNAPVRSCISKINDTFIDNVKDKDIVMSIYNLLNYSDNYSVTSEICDIILDMK